MRGACPRPATLTLPRMSAGKVRRGGPGPRGLGTEGPTNGGLRGPGPALSTPPSRTLAAAPRAGAGGGGNTPADSALGGAASPGAARKSEGLSREPVTAAAIFSPPLLTSLMPLARRDRAPPVCRKGGREVGNMNRVGWGKEEEEEEKGGGAAVAARDAPGSGTSADDSKEAEYRSQSLDRVGRVGIVG